MDDHFGGRRDHDPGMIVWPHSKILEPFTEGGKVASCHFLVPWGRAFYQYESQLHWIASEVHRWGIGLIRFGPRFCKFCQLAPSKNIFRHALGRLPCCLWLAQSLMSAMVSSLGAADFCNFISGGCWRPCDIDYHITSSGPGIDASSGPEKLKLGPI